MKVKTTVSNVLDALKEYPFTYVMIKRLRKEEATDEKKFVVEMEASGEASLKLYAEKEKEIPQLIKKIIRFFKEEFPTEDKTREVAINKIDEVIKRFGEATFDVLFVYYPNNEDEFEITLDAHQGGDLLYSYFKNEELGVWVRREK